MKDPKTNITVREILRNSILQLKSHYPAEEAEALAYAVCRACTGLNRTGVCLHGEQPVPEEGRWRQMVSLLLQDKPLAYITGTAPFFGLELHVNHSVLIPRPETEELVDWILRDHPEDGRTLRVLDIGTGSGCIAIALASQRPRWAVTGCDISAAALGTARRNAGMLHTDVQWTACDILSDNPLPDTACFDLIVSNPPYVTPSQKTFMHPNVLLYEPHEALFVPEEDATVFYRAIARSAQSHLTPRGSVYVEINEEKPDLTRRAFLEQGFEDVRLRRDINGKWRMLRASRTATDSVS